MSAWLFCEGKRRIYQDKRFQDSGHFPNFSYIFTLVEKLVIHLFRVYFASMGLLYRAEPKK